MMEMANFWIGLIYAAFGYALKKWQDPGVGFDSTKFLKTVLIGFAVATISTVTGLPMTEVEAMGLVAFLTVIIDKVINAYLSKKEAEVEEKP